MKNKKGFTLVEIMIVVVIIGLLAAMAVPAFKQVRENALKKTAVSDMRLITTGAQQYFMDNPTLTSVNSTSMVGTDQLLKAHSPGVTVAAQTISVTGGSLSASVTGGATVAFTY